MDDMVYVCLGCRKTFTGGKFRWWDMPKCPECGKKIVSTGKTKERWMAMTAEERSAYVDDIFDGSVEPEVMSPERRPEQKRDEGVMDFVNARIGVVQGIKTVLTILFWICVFIFMVALASDEMAMAAVMGSAAGGMLLLLADLYLACCFCKVAILKGHNECMYFWVPFIFTLVGYLLVIALPDRKE